MITKLVCPPKDTISDASFIGDRLVVSSWDQNIRFYDTQKNKLLLAEKTDTPILSHVTHDGKVIYGGLDRILYSYDANKDMTVKLYGHKNAIHNICYQPSTNFLFVSDWENKINIFDDRTKHGLVFEILNFGTIYTMDVNESKLLVGDSVRRTYIFDSTKGIDGFTVPYYKDNILKYQFRCIKAFPNQQGFVLSSVEGRVAWEHFEEKDKEELAEHKRYTFKCHREKVVLGEIAYPINTMDFHPVNGMLYTGGSDGVMCAWDAINKKRIWKSPEFSNEITKIKFNDTGNELCICVSAYLKADKKSSPQKGENAVYIYQLTDKDTKTKKKN